MRYFRPRLLRRSLVHFAGVLSGLTTGVALADSSADIETMQLVVVSATRHALSVADAPAATTVLSREQIEMKAADNVLDALRGETGITVFGRTIAGRKALALRGLDPKHTLFLVDGKRISATDGVIGHTDFQLDWVAMPEVERIEVVRGPLASLYGAEALGGVVQIFTRAPSKKFEADAVVDAFHADSDRGGDGHRASARLSSPLNDSLAASLSITDARRQAVASALDPRLSDLEGRSRVDVSGRILWQAAQGHNIDLEHRVGREERWANAIEKSGRRRLYESDTGVDRDHSSLTWTADWSASGNLAREINTTIRLYRTRLEMTNARTNGVAALRPNTLDDRVVEAVLAVQPAKAHAVTAGVEAREERLVNAGLPGGDAQVNHSSLYVQDEWSATRAITVTSGLRYDSHQRFGNQWSPRLYGVWRLTPEWVLKGGYSHGFKPPTLKQVTPGYQEDEGPYTYVSNPGVRAERNDGFEIGAVWDTERVGVQAMLFDNRVHDLIVPRLLGVISGRTTYVFDNIDRAKLLGGEATANVRVGSQWRLSASYQYLDARDGFDQRIEKRPRHTLGAAVDWVHGVWRANLRIDSTAGQVIATAVPGQSPQAAPSLTYIGASVARDFGNGLRAVASVSNLTNVNPAERSALFTWGEVPRTFRLSLHARW